MKQPIGFQLPADPAGEAPGEERRLPRETPAPSVARVYFPQRQMAFSYYNDAFDLRKGDLVYVEGKLAGMLGQVVEVSRTFKIRLADYKRVIGRAQTRLTGEFFHAGAYLLAFDPAALSREAASTWFWPPAPEGEVFASASDGDAFPLEGLAAQFRPEIAARGLDYYREERVRCLCLDGERGWAAVAGSEYYEVEFSCAGGQVSDLVCSCFCAYPCKHEFAALTLLRQLLETVKEEYSPQYARSGYLAAVQKEGFFSFVLRGREEGRLIL